MIKLTSPDIREEDIKRVTDVLRTGDLVQGSNVAFFETMLAEYTELPYSTVISSCTAGLHLSLIALGIGRGDTVVVPAFTFPATANAVENVGANVLMTDVDETTYAITPESIEKTLRNNCNANIKAVIAVHEFGYPVRVRELAEIADRNKIFLIEDGACALGTIADGHHIGFFGTLACFSFHPRKAITSGEGGVVLTGNKDISQKIALLRNHGITTGIDGADFVCPGLNYRMTDFQAALAIGQLGRFDKDLMKRKDIVKKYIERLKGLKKISLPKGHPGHSWQSFMIVLDDSINRNMVIERLRKKGIQANLGAQALHCLSYYRGKYKYKDSDFSTAERLYRNGLVLPLYGGLQVTDIDYIAETLISIVSSC